MRIKNKKIVVISLFSLILIGTILLFLIKSNKNALYLISKSNDQITMIEFSNGNSKVIKKVPTTGNWEMEYECDNDDIKLKWNDEEKKLTSNNINLGKCKVTFKKISDISNMVAFYVNNQYVSELDGKTLYSLASYECSNNETVTWDLLKNELSINPITVTTSCSIYFTDYCTGTNANKLICKMLTSNTAISDASVDFTITSEEGNTNGLYYTADATAYGEDSAKIYYYRGNVTNNWVSLGGYLWRIVRTTSEGGVRLAYAGDGSTTSSAFISFNSMYNSTNSLKYYIGYIYNTASYLGTQTASTIKCSLDAWYTGSSATCDGTNYSYSGLTTKLSDYSGYLSTTAIYCNDKSVEYNYNGEIWTSGNIRYPSTNRFILYQRPTFACPSTNGSRYTASTSTGNGYLTNPIALLSADEVAYAGLTISTTGTTTTSYIMNNATGRYTWTMSPYAFDGTAYMLFVSTSGFLSNASTSGNYGVRPVISLKPCVTVSGTGSGTQSSPYVLSNSSCS